MLIELVTLGRDAELRYTPDNTPVANLALAYNYGRKDQSGNTPTQWVDASLWGKRAESLAQYLTKGTQIVAYIEDLHIEEFARKDGTNGSKLVGRIADIKLTRGGQKYEQGQGAQQAPIKPAQQQYQQPTQQPQQGQGFNQYDDDIPFN